MRVNKPNSSRTFSKKFFDCGCTSSPLASANLSSNSRCFCVIERPTH
ncbi:hypothetical protein ACN28E_07265 [Archangium lansingense]